MKLPENVSESVRRRNPEVYQSGTTGTIGPSLRLPILAHTTDVLKLNKTERAYYDWLLTMDYPWVGVQCFTLKLGDDTRYTPDFWILDTNGCLVAIEVKGFWRDDAKVKIKVAARMYAFFIFKVVTKVKGDWGWSHSIVKP